MVNPNGDVAERRTQVSTQTVEEAGPPRIMGNYLNSLRQQGPSDILGGQNLFSSPLLPTQCRSTSPPRVSQFLVSIVYCECFSGGPNNKEGWTAGTRPSRQRIIVAWAGSHHRSKVDCTGEDLRLHAVERPPLKSPVGVAYSDTCRPGAQRAGSLNVPFQF